MTIELFPRQNYLGHVPTVPYPGSYADAFIEGFPLLIG